MSSFQGLGGTQTTAEPAVIESVPVEAAFTAGHRRAWLGATNRDAVARRLLALADATAASLAIWATLILCGAHPRPLAFAALPLIVLISKIGGTYDRDELLLRRSTLEEAPRLFQVATLCTLILWLSRSLLFSALHGRRDLAVLWFTLFGFQLLIRTGARSAARMLTPPERCLLIGDSETTRRFQEKIARRLSLHAVVAGCVDREGQDADIGSDSLSEEDLRKLIEEARADRVLVTHGWGGDAEVTRVVQMASALGAKVTVMPSLLEVVGTAGQYDEVEGTPLLSIPRLRLSRSSWLIKRSVDVCVAPVGLAILAPLFLVVALAIRLDSPGPVLFRQRRVGRDGRDFEMLKFRTMVQGADAQKSSLRHLCDADGLFKLAHDPRVTFVGRLLRRTSVDELPQLLNVLRGDMSLVGPRPLVPDEDALVEGWHRRRLELTPGMTGHWQVLGSARIPVTEMVGIDYLYVTNWSLWLDIKILLRTVGYIVRREGQ